MLEILTGGLILTVLVVLSLIVVWCVLTIIAVTADAFVEYQSVRYGATALLGLFIACTGIVALVKLFGR